VGAGCNNGCLPCVWTRKMSFRPTVESAHLGARPAAPSDSGVDVVGRRIELSGREPTIRADLPALIESLVTAGAAEVELETNGRRFVYPGYARRLAQAGLDGVSVKLFGITSGAWDAHTRVEGSFAQTLTGLAELALVPELRVTGVAFPGCAPGTTVDDYLAFAASIGLARLRLMLELPRQDLLALPSLEARLRELVSTPGAPILGVSE
jgi:molybdenum cofactor biosynthesis enzyme MoaA